MWLYLKKTTQNCKEKQQAIIQEVSGAGKGRAMCFSPGCKGSAGEISWGRIGARPLVSVQK